MAITQAQPSAGTQFANSAATRSQAYGSNVTAPNLLVLAVVTGGSSSASALSVTDTIGNNWQQAGSYATWNSQLTRVSIWYCITVGAGPNTVSFQPSTSVTMTLAVHEYHGVSSNPFTVLDGTVTNSGASTSSPTTSTTCAVSVTGDMIFAVYGCRDNQGVVTPGGGYTNRKNIAGDGTLLGIATEDALSVSSSQVANWSTSVGVAYACVAASFKASQPFGKA